MIHEHTVSVNAGDTNGLCEVCGDSVSINFGDREGVCDPFKSAVEEHLDLSHQVPPDFYENEYLPEALFEILRLDSRGWDPQSPFLARLMDRLPLRWLHALAGCGLSLVLASRHSELFAIDAQCRLSARQMEELEEEAALDTHQMEDEVLEEVGRNLTEFYAGDASVHALEEKYDALENSFKQSDVELKRMEAKMHAVMTSNLSEAAQIHLLRDSNRENLDRRIQLETCLLATTEELVQLNFDRQWQALKQLETEASAILGKLNRMKDNYKNSTPALDASFAQWEEFQEQLTESGRRLLALKEAETSELKKGTSALPFHSKLALADLPLKPSAPNFAAILEEAKRRDRPASSVKSLSRSTSGGLSDSVVSLNRASHLASPTHTTSPTDDLLKRLNEMIPDIRREDLDRMLSDLDIGPGVSSMNPDHLLQLLTEKWFQSN